MRYCCVSQYEPMCIGSSNCYLSFIYWCVVYAAFQANKVVFFSRDKPTAFTQFLASNLCFGHCRFSNKRSGTAVFMCCCYMQPLFYVWMFSPQW